MTPSELLSKNSFCHPALIIFNSTILHRSAKIVTVLCFIPNVASKHFYCRVASRLCDVSLSTERKTSASNLWAPYLFYNLFISFTLLGQNFANPSRLCLFQFTNLTPYRRIHKIANNQLGQQNNLSITYKNC